MLSMGESQDSLQFGAAHLARQGRHQGLDLYGTLVGTLYGILVGTLYGALYGTLYGTLYGILSGILGGPSKVGSFQVRSSSV